jgi:hypothetical protein
MLRLCSASTLSCVEGSTWLRVARGAEDTEKDFLEHIAGSLKGPSPSERSRCKASRPMWRVLGIKISSLIFFPKTAPHRTLTRSLSLSACPAIALATAGAIRVFRKAKPVSKRIFRVFAFSCFRDHLFYLLLLPCSGSEGPLLKSALCAALLLSLIQN